MPGARVSAFGYNGRCASLRSRATDARFANDLLAEKQLSVTKRDAKEGCLTLKQAMEKVRREHPCRALGGLNCRRARVCAACGNAAVCSRQRRTFVD